MGAQNLDFVTKILHMTLNFFKKFHFQHQILRI